MTRPSFFSVIVPVRDGGAAFDRCLEALDRSRFRDWELIVVDDGSRDGSADRAHRAGARVLSTGGGGGPAAARNLGARHARGAYLLFLDADCEVEPGTLATLAERLRIDPPVAAAFGSYDESPAASGLVARYKNLVHHHVHQRGREEASTFWAGCGAVRRSVFLELGGFDEDRYRRPSIEDIELGRRLRKAGHRIGLVRQARVKHHKVWTLSTLVRTDVLRRGVPWTELILEERHMPDALNLRAADRASVAASWTLVGLLVASPWLPTLLYGAPLPAAVLAAANRDLYRFFRRTAGQGFALRAMALHLLYFLYSGVAFGLGTGRFLARRLAPSLRGERRAPLPPPDRDRNLAGEIGHEI